MPVVRRWRCHGISVKNLVLVYRDEKDLALIESSRNCEAGAATTTSRLAIRHFFQLQRGLVDASSAHP